MRSACRRLRAARRILLGIAVFVGLYSAAGFLLVPHLLQAGLWTVLAEQLGGQWSAAGVTLNPFTLRLEVRGFVLRDPAGRELVAVPMASADIDGIESLRQRALVVSSSLQAPQVAFELGKDGASNFSFLLRYAAPRSSSTPIPRFRVVRLIVEHGKLSFTDQSQAHAYKTALSSLNFSLENLSASASETAHFRLSAEGEHHDELKAHGSLRLLPTVSEGEITLKGFALATLGPYLSTLEPYRIGGGKLSLGIHYRLHGGASGTRFEIRSAEAQAHDFALAVGLHEQFLRVGSLAAKGFSLAPDLNRVGLSLVSLRDIDLQATTPHARTGDEFHKTHVGALDIGSITLGLREKSLTIAQVSSESTQLAAWITPEGAFSLLGMPEATPAVPRQPTPTTDDPWHVKIGAINLRRSEALFTDFSVTPPVELKLAPINLELTDFSSEAGTEFKMRLDAGLGEKGHAAAEGKIILRPVLMADLRLAVEQLGIGRFQPYLDKFTQISLNKGRLDISGDFDFYQGPVDSIRFSGQAAVTGLSIAEKRTGKDLVRWKEMQINGLIFETIPKRLRVREIIATEPYANVVIGEDGKVNVAQALAGPPDAQERPGATTARAGEADARMDNSEPSNSLPIVIGALRIARGRADFADLTLQPIHFAVGINDLNGDVRGLSSQRDAKSAVLLEGKLDQNSPVTIIGQANPFNMGTHTDIAMRFRNVNLTTLSPYSGKFAGYRIEKGKMSMDLRYRLDDGQLVADNKFQLDQLVLGERVESQEATSLPVKLAVALLKDRSGRIDLELPIRGDLRDPRVSVRGLLANAATQLLTKLVSTPISLLGDISAGSGEELDNVNFDAGSSLLKANEKDKLAKVSMALRERPGVNIEIKGEANPEQDRQALAERQLMRQLQSARRMESRMQGAPTEAEEDTDLSDEEYRRLFTQYCRVKAPDIPEIKALSANGTELLSGKSLEGAKRRVLEKWSVDELELRSLAQARGQSVRDYFVKEAGMPDERIFLLDVRFTKPEEKQIKAMLSLSSS